MPLISVIIPAYNADKTILETVASVQNQTFRDFEIVVINDGSFDNTLEVLLSVSDERLKVYSYQNGGLSIARNRGIAHATGEFIAFLDSDDLWSPDKLECQLAKLNEHPNAGVAYSWTYFMEDGEKPQVLHPCDPVFFEGNVYEKLLVGDFIYNGSNTLVRRSAVADIGGFDPDINPCADWDYWVRLASKWSFVVVPKYQVYYRRSSGAMSAKVDVMRDASQIAIEKAFKAAPVHLQPLKHQCMTNFNLYCSNLYFQHSKDSIMLGESTFHLWKAIKSQPYLLRKAHIWKMLIKLIIAHLTSPDFTRSLLSARRKIDLT